MEYCKFCKDMAMSFCEDCGKGTCLDHGKLCDGCQIDLCQECNVVKDPKSLDSLCKQCYGLDYQSQRKRREKNRILPTTDQIMTSSPEQLMKLFAKSEEKLEKKWIEHQEKK